MDWTRRLIALAVYIGAGAGAATIPGIGTEALAVVWPPLTSWFYLRVMPDGSRLRTRGILIGALGNGYGNLLGMISILTHPAAHDPLGWLPPVIGMAIDAGWLVWYFRKWLNDKRKRVAKLIGAKARAIRDGLVARMPKPAMPRVLIPVPVARAVATVVVTGGLLAAGNGCGPSLSQDRQHHHHLYPAVVLTAFTEHGVHPGAHVATCDQQATYQVGVFRADNDLFNHAPGTSCMTASLHGGGVATIRTTSACTPWGGGVSSYRQLRYGPKFASKDRRSELPLRIDRLGRLTFHVHVRNRPGGQWIDDIDGWLRPDGNYRKPGTHEFVIGTASRGWTAGTNLVTIGGHRYLEETHITGSGAGWPLTTFRPVRQTYDRAYHLSDFLNWMAHRHLVSRRNYLLNAAFGQECWSGGKGQVLSARISGTIPVLHAPPSRGETA